MRRVPLLLVLSMCCSAGCRQNSTSAEEVRIEPRAAGPSVTPALPDGFAAFYDRFHTDSAFQMAHVTWPLAGNVQRDSTGAAVDVRYAREEWVVQTLPERSDEFVRSVEAVSDGLVLEQIRARAGGFGIQRRFALLDGAWNLIYYEASVAGD